VLYCGKYDFADINICL